MSEEKSKIGAAVMDLRDLASAADYVEYEACFNGERFYEAHDALEPRWLRVRDRTEGLFLKGLIQLAGAFVHVQKGRVGPARALLARARHHLAPFSASITPVAVPAVLALLEEWDDRLARARAGDLLLTEHPSPSLPRSRDPGPGML
jgi:hypothetical protein